MKAPLRYSGNATATMVRNRLNLESAIPQTWCPQVEWVRTEVVRNVFRFILARPMVRSFFSLVLTFFILAKCVLADLLLPAVLSQPRSRALQAQCTGTPAAFTSLPRSPLKVVSETTIAFLAEIVSCNSANPLHKAAAPAGKRFRMKLLVPSTL